MLAQVTPPAIVQAGAPTASQRAGANDPADHPGATHAAAPAAAATARPGAAAGVESYPASFFAAAQPVTANDMIARVPGFKDLALEIHRSPEVNPLAIELHVHSVEMPALLAKAPHPAHPLATDVAGRQWFEPVPSLPRCLVADVDPTLNSRSSTYPQRERTYIITISRITSGDELK